MRAPTMLLLMGALAQSASATLHAEADRVETRFHPDGRVASVRYSLRGEKTGTHRSWDEHGTLRWEARFVDGVYDGESREWHADGRLARVRRFDLGREAGLQQAWTPDGTLFLNYEAREGRRFGLQNAQPCVPVHGTVAP